MHAQKKRAKRHDAARRRLRRWQAFVKGAITTVGPGIYSPEEAVALLAGSLNEAKRAYRAAKRRELGRDAGEESTRLGIENSSELRTIPPPSREMSRLNRSRVFPPLVPKKLQVEALSVHEILSMLQHGDGDALPHHLLDVVATASGMSWENCAEILLGHKMIPHRIDHGQISATRAARSVSSQRQRRSEISL